jgi:cytochrome c
MSQLQELQYLMTDALERVWQLLQTTLKVIFGNDLNCIICNLQVNASLLVVTCVCTVQTNRKHAQVYNKSPQLAKKFEHVQSYRKSTQVGVQTCVIV